MSKDGGPAFPQAPNGHPDNKHPGMSLRDYFAAAALQGILAACFEEPDWGSEESDRAIAKNSYGIADAMLAEREKERK